MSKTKPTNFELNIANKAAAKPPIPANRAARLVKLIATCGPLDIDDPQPAITVTLPDED